MKKFSITNGSNGTNGKIFGTLVSVFLMTSVLLVAVSCNKSKNQNTEPVRIAIALPMTGDNAEYGQSFLTAAEIMRDKWNAAGGVDGRQVEFVVYDDKNQPEEAASIAQRIVSDKTIPAVLGHFSSGVSMTAAPTYQENKVIEISNCASHPDYSKIGNYIFRNNTAIDAEFRVLVDVIANDLDLHKVGVIAIKTDWGTTAGKIACDLIDAQPGLELTAYEQVLETSDDYGPAIAKLKSSGAEAVVAVGMYSLYGPLARQYREVDPNIKLVGVSNAYTQQIIQLGGDAVNGMFVPVSFYSQSTDPAVLSFVEEFTKRFKMEPSSLAAQAYDSIGILLEAIKVAGTTDRDKLRDAVASIEYDGISGYTEFSEQGDATKHFQKVIIADGKFIPFVKQ